MTNLRNRGCEVDGTGSGSSPMVGFGISSVETLGSVPERELGNYDHTATDSLANSSTLAVPDKVRNSKYVLILNPIKAIKSRRMRWVGHVARPGG